jgi:hypothetical protein
MGGKAKRSQGPVDILHVNESHAKRACTRELDSCREYEASLLHHCFSPCTLLLYYHFKIFLTSEVGSASV